MTAREAIDKVLNAGHVRDIFLDNPDNVRQIYHDYAKLIHPDVCEEPDAQQAFVMLQEYYQYSLDHAGEFGTTANMPYYMAGSKILLYKALDIQAFELGARYTCDKQVVYIFDSGKEKYYENYKKQVYDNISSNFVDRKVFNSYVQTVPSFEYSGTTPVGRSIIGVKKDPGEYPLDLFVKGYKDTMNGRDIAWIVSRLVSLCCLLRHGFNAAMVLNGFTENNLFINPELHSLHLYGGWWYATQMGKQMLGTSADVYSCMSTKTKTDHISTPLTDMESIKAIARRISDGIPDIPQPMLDWMNSGSLINPVEESTRWDNALRLGYGPRNFKEFEPIDTAKIYTQKRN